MSAARPKRAPDIRYKHSKLSSRELSGPHPAETQNAKANESGKDTAQTSEDSSTSRLELPWAWPLRTRLTSHTHTTHVVVHDDRLTAYTVHRLICVSLHIPVHKLRVWAHMRATV